ncbi:hypothetical protein ACF068_09390 [Streptomyces sp. NPDC016309]|uniref:hypothetical protein n=1 Tax=Streptomyces sp. NPDC016309 TaxID=3364965 RepID=UPI0036FEEB15
MTTDDPTTRPTGAAPDRAGPPHPPDPPDRPDPAGVPVDATHTEAPPFGTVHVDAAHAEALRLAAAAPPPAPAAPPAATTYANGTYTNGAYANGTYSRATPEATPAYGVPATADRAPDDHEATGTTPGAAVHREPPYREAPDRRPHAETAGDAAATGTAPAGGTPAPAVAAVPTLDGAPADAARPDTARPDAARTDAAAGDVTASPEGPSTDPVTGDAVDAAPDVPRADADPSAVDTALVDAVLGETSGAGTDDEDGDERIRTLIWTAATYRPLEEVAALVTQLKNTKAVDSPADEALRAAAVARPLEEVRQLVAMLNEAGHTLDDNDTTLRAAAVGRPIEDVVQLVSILGTGDGQDPPVITGTAPAVSGPVVPENPHVRPPRSVTGAPAAAQETKVLVPEPAGGPAEPSPRSGLRWPAAAALFACGVIHLPTDFGGLRSGGYADALALVVTVVCLVLGEWLIVRDSPRVWGFAAATSVGVVALHGIAGSSGFALLESSLGRTWALSGAAAVTCAMLTALLAGSALLRRQRQPDAADGV